MFDAASALIVRHADPVVLGGALPICSKGGGMSQQASHSLDYDSRSKEWEEKGGIDREATDEDRELFAAARQLDYVARLGAFSEKGAEEMVDCTFFGQHGPVSREDVEADMLSCGGCFMRSIVTVDRRNAAELGLDSKAGFESLLRSTWARSIVGEQARTLPDGRKAPGIKGWGVTSNVQDVRWIANYHTDQANNLHCHVTTWFADGARCFNEQGWTVSAAATRGQKEIIYREAYRIPLRERVYPEKDYERAMAVAQAKAELGIPEGPREQRRRERVAAQVGKPSEARRTVEGADRQHVEAKVAKMQQAYAEGRGRKSSNYALEAAARDVHKELMERSAPYRAHVDAYRAHVSVLADAKGLALLGEGEDGRAEGAREVIAHERDRYVRSQMDELVRHRIVPAIEAVASVERLVREAAREPLARLLPPKEVGAALDRAVPIAEQRAAIREGKVPQLAECAMSAPGIDQAVRTAAAQVSERLAAQGREVPIGKVEQAVRAQALEKAASQIERGGMAELDRREAREAAHTVRDALRELRVPAAQAAIQDGGIKLGLTRGESQQVAAAMAEVAALKAVNAPQAQVAAAADRAAAVITASPVVQELVERAARSHSAATGTPLEDAREKVGQKAHQAVSQQVEQKAPALQQQAFQAAAMQPMAPPPMAQPMGLGGTLGSMIASIASGLAGQAAKQEARKAGKGNAIDQRQLDVDHGRER